MEVLTSCFILIVHLLASVKTQPLEKDQVALICPKGLLAGGVSWYYQANKKNFTICINCKPEREGRYQWIEICFANNEEPLAGPFGWDTQSCENKPFVDANQFMQKLCQETKSVCGFSIKTGTVTLDLALRNVQSIPCLSVISDATAIVSIMANTADYDVELVCPENATLFGFQRFYLPVSGGKIPVLSAICKLKDNIKDSLIFIYAKGILYDTTMMDSLDKHETYPDPFVKDRGTGCKLRDKSSSMFCGLKWHVNNIIEFSKCSQIRTLPAHESVLSSQVSVTPLQISASRAEGTTASMEVSIPQSHKSAPQPHISVTTGQLSLQLFGKENNQYINIIIGICCVFFILIIIFITIHIMKVKKLGRASEFKKNDRTDRIDNTSTKEGTNIVCFEQQDDLDLAYEEVEAEQIELGVKTLQRRNLKISIHSSEKIILQSNDRYLYTVPDREENSLSQASERTKYVNEDMFIE